MAVVAQVATAQRITIQRLATERITRIQMHPVVDRAVVQDRTAIRLPPTVDVPLVAIRHRRVRLRRVRIMSVHHHVADPTRNRIAAEAATAGEVTRSQASRSHLIRGRASHRISQASRLTSSQAVVTAPQRQATVRQAIVRRVQAVAAVATQAVAAAHVVQGRLT